jgi:hypothetical protein
MSDTVAVEFVAEIRQVKTMADHTVNVVLNLPEYCVKQAAWFMQHQGEMVKSVSEVYLINREDQNGEMDKGAKREHRWKASKGTGDSRGADEGVSEVAD